MNSLQKQSWLTIIMATLSLLAFAALYPVFGFLPAFAAFSLFGISGLGPLFWKKDRLDERDRAISRRAGIIAYAISYSVFVVGTMGTWTALYSFQHHEEVSIHLLPLITGAGGIAFFLTQAIFTLIFYRGTTEADHG
jgi:hypothetical protein